MNVPIPFCSSFTVRVALYPLDSDTVRAALYPLHVCDLVKWFFPLQSKQEIAISRTSVRWMG